MSGHTFWKHLSWIAVAAAIAPRIVIPASAQTQSVESNHSGVPAAAARKSPRIYEDGEIKVEIPEAWSIVSNPNSSNPGKKHPEGTLLLVKRGYTLSLAYHTGHASGIDGGRFIEIFNIPWPGVDDGWTCGGYLREDPWPASRQLIFVNLIVESGDPKVRENCGIQRELGSWSEKDGQ